MNKLHLFQIYLPKLELGKEEIRLPFGKKEKFSFSSPDGALLIRDFQLELGKEVRITNGA